MWFVSRGGRGRSKERREEGGYDVVGLSFMAIPLPFEMCQEEARDTRYSSIALRALPC